MSSSGKENAGETNPHIERYGKVRVDRSGLFNMLKTNPIDGCEVIGDVDEEKQNDDCDTTYSVLGKDIPLQAGMSSLTISTCHRIRQLVNLDIIGSSLKKLTIIANCVERIEGLETLRNLEHLELYQNRLKTIENLECLPNLRVLDLSFNSIRSVDYLNEKLPFAKGLTKLYLSNNKIVEIPQGTLEHFPNLELLELGANRLREIPACVRKLSNLRELWLGKNKIRTMELEQPAESSSSELGKPLLPFLKHCSLQANRLTSYHTNFFKNCPNLTHFYLSENQLGDFEFPQTFGHLKALTELDLSQNVITTIPKDFKLEALRELWINANRIDFDDVNSPGIAGLWNLRLSCLYMEHNPGYDGNFKDGGERYKKTLRRVCGPCLLQLDAILFAMQQKIEEDKFGTVYATRDNSVPGIRKITRELEGRDLTPGNRVTTPRSSGSAETSPLGTPELLTLAEEFSEKGWCVVPNALESKLTRGFIDHLSDRLRRPTSEKSPIDLADPTSWPPGNICVDGFHGDVDNLERSQGRLKAGVDSVLGEGLWSANGKDWYLACCFPERSTVLGNESEEEASSSPVHDRPWTETEDKILLTNFNEFGPAWNKLSSKLSNRPRRSVRSRVTALVERVPCKGWHLEADGQTHEGLILLLLLSDCESGTALVTGSHKWIGEKVTEKEFPTGGLTSWAEEALEEKRKKGEVVIDQVRGRAGDAVLIHPLLLYGETPNLSDNKVRMMATGRLRLKEG